MTSKIKDKDAAEKAMLQVYAMDMFTAGNLTPDPDPRISQSGWEVVGYLNASDAIINEGRKMGLGDQVYYGFLAKSQSNPNEYVVVVRGTNGITEWIEDAEFQLVPYRPAPSCRVEEGFFGIYQSMQYISKDKPAVPVLDGLAETIGSGSVTVCGHSLGSALATYLSLGLAREKNMKSQTTVNLLASPRPGDKAFADLFQTYLGEHLTLYNYVFDIVPHLPMRLMGYISLNGAEEISLSEAEARIKCDLGCNHHAVCYAAMLYYELMDWQNAFTSPDDVDCAQCIEGSDLS
jgi:triacylglycerol lipase